MTNFIIEQALLDALKNDLKTNATLKVLGIDLGRKKTGSAIGHISTGVIVPHQIIEEKNLKEVASSVFSLCKNREIFDVVLGIPLQNDATGSIPTYMLKFAAYLKKEDKIRLYFEDESLSSCIANEKLGELEMRRKSKDQISDSVAACIILERFFQRLGNMAFN